MKTFTTQNPGKKDKGKTRIAPGFPELYAEASEIITARAIQFVTNARVKENGAMAYHVPVAGA